MILDFCHVAERLAGLADAWHGPGTEASRGQFEAWAHRLKHAGGAAVLEELRGLELPSRSALHELHRTVLGYLESHAHRMDYPTIGRGAGRSARARWRRRARR